MSGVLFLGGIVVAVFVILWIVAAASNAISDDKAKQDFKTRYANDRDFRRAVDRQRIADGYYRNEL